MEDEAVIAVMNERLRSIHEELLPGIKKSVDEVKDEVGTLKVTVDQHDKYITAHQAIGRAALKVVGWVGFVVTVITGIVGSLYSGKLADGVSR